MKKTHTHFFLISIFSLFFFGLGSPIAFGATISFFTEDTVFGVGQTIHVDVVLNTENSTINTVSGSLSLPENIVRVVSVETGKSIVPLWIDEPSLKNIVHKDGSGKITFSGIIPNGYSGKSGILFSFLLGGASVGKTSLHFQDVYTLLNNSTGKKISVESGPLTLSVLKQAVPTVTSQVIRDVTAPERFQLYIAQNPGMFEGKYFIIFSAIDTESGIDRYELFESTSLYSTENLLKNQNVTWRVVKNPTLINDQSLKSYIYVRAIDREGNISITSLPPGGKLSPDFFLILFNWKFISGILFIMALVFVIILKKRHARIIS